MSPDPSRRSIDLVVAYPGNRLKNGSPAVHPIREDEPRALRRPRREQVPKSAFAFVSERGSPFTTVGLARMVEPAGREAGFGFKAHPNMLRHACGYTLANRGHDTRAQAYLGHRNIQHALHGVGPGSVQGFLAVADGAETRRTKMIFAPLHAKRFEFVCGRVEVEWQA